MMRVIFDLLIDVLLKSLERLQMRSPISEAKLLVWVLSKLALTMIEILEKQVKVNLMLEN